MTPISWSTKTLRLFCVLFHSNLCCIHRVGNGCYFAAPCVCNHTNETSHLLAYSCSCYYSCCLCYRSEWYLCTLTIECIHTGIQKYAGEYILSPVSSTKLNQVTVLKRICLLWLLQLVGSSHMLILQSLD
jgi:hypothetical protein